MEESNTKENEEIDDIVIDDESIAIEDHVDTARCREINNKLETGDTLSAWNSKKRSFD